MDETFSFYINACPASIKKKLAHVNFTAGGLVLSQGDPAAYVYVLLAGEARVYHMTLNGINFLEYVYGEQGFFGEMEVLYDRPVLADVVAQSDCRTLRIEKEDFLSWMRTDPNFALFIARQVAEKFYQAMLSNTTQLAYPLKYRVLYLLWSLPANSGASILKEDLITRLASNERSINRILKDLAEAGLVQTEKGRVRPVSIGGIMGEMRRYEM